MPCRDRCFRTSATRVFRPHGLPVSLAPDRYNSTATLAYTRASESNSSDGKDSMVRSLRASVDSGTSCHSIAIVAHWRNRVSRWNRGKFGRNLQRHCIAWVWRLGARQVSPRNVAKPCTSGREASIQMRASPVLASFAADSGETRGISVGAS